MRLALLPAESGDEFKLWADSGQRGVCGKFHIKLWNCYSFFVNYDGSTGLTQLRRKRRRMQDIDRWILSDLQGLIARMRARRRTNLVQRDGVLPGGRALRR